jgi:UDP-N-acetylmuramate--alanine ligase
MTVGPTKREEEENINLYKIDFKQPIHIHFIGIGGISMSGLAQVLLMEGFKVSGSDLTPSSITQELEDKGAFIIYEQTASNISSKIDCVVYTAAIAQDNEELLAAKEENIPLLTRAQLLGQVMHNYKYPIAVAGTHGKTTTTSMIATILLKGNLDPTISVGGILPLIGGNIRVGQSDIFITEACEYANSFLDFNPNISVILNIEEEHLDFFKDLDDVMNSFKLFAAKLPKDGNLVINGEIKQYRQITAGLDCNVITYGLSGDFNYTAANISHDEKARASFDLLKDGQLIERVFLSIPGEHNVSNALASIATAQVLGLSIEEIASTITNFSGTARRFEYKGNFGGVDVIDDYAHHPTEVAATLSAVAHYPHRELWCVFQPHTYTRTKALFDDFVEVLSGVDHLILTDIYAAREKNTIGITSVDLLEKIKEKGTDVYYFSSFEKAEEFLQKNCFSGDLLITMGAGNVVNIGENLLKK